MLAELESCMCAAAALCLQVEIDGASLSNLIGSFAIASFAVYTYSTAKK